MSEKRAVIIMYPDTRTTGEGVLADNGAHLHYLPYTFAKTMKKILGCYIRQGNELIGIVYADTTSQALSHLYPLELFSRNISVESTFSNWTHEAHPQQLRAVVEQINFPLRVEFIVGGFHANDCVATMAGVLRACGYRSQIDLRLTEKVVFLLTSHYARKFTNCALYSKADKRESYESDRLAWEALKEDTNRRIVRY